MRVNLIPTYELTDQHLVAEYCEQFMLVGMLQKTLNSKQGFVPSRVPKEFTLNKGHAYFFFNKGRFIYQRFEKLKWEMKARKISVNRHFPLWAWPDKLFNDWTPSERDISISRQRIIERIAKKPEWYRYKKGKLDIDHFIGAYDNGYQKA